MRLRSLFHLLLIGLVGLVVLAACGQAETAPQAEPVVELPAAPDVSEESQPAEVAVVEEAVEEAVVETDAEVVAETEPAEEMVEEAQAEMAEAAPRPDPSDIALVGNTGRPQFLNSFANW